MSQPNYVLDLNKIDVGKIQNLVFSAKTQKEHKTYSTLFDVFYALLSSFVLFLGLCGNFILTPFPALCYIAILVFPAMSVYTLLYSNTASKLVLLISAPVASGIYFALTNTPIKAIINTLFVYILCVLTGAFISICVIKKRTKLYIFVGLSAIAVIVALCNLAFFHIYTHGTLSVLSIVSSIDGFFENLYNSYSLAYDEVLTSFGVTDLKEIAAVKQELKVLLSAVRLALPSIFVLTGMFWSFIVIAVFSRFAKLFKIDVFVCIMDEFWTYRLPSVTLKMYDIVVFAFIIGMFVNLPQNVSATIVNLLIIMTPLVFAVGLRSIYTYMLGKGKSKLKSKTICTLIVIAAFAVTGMWAIYLISSVGIVFIASKDKFEKSIVGEKILFDEAVLRGEYPKEESQNTPQDITSDNDNNLE